MNLHPNYAAIWPGSLTLLDAMLDGMSPGEALEHVPASELPRTDAELRIWDQISTGEIPTPPAPAELPLFMREAEAQAPRTLQGPAELERELARQVYTYQDIADMLVQARQEAATYPEAVETRENRAGALRKALAGRQWDAGRTYRAPVFRPMEEPPKVQVSREQWEAIDAMDADLLAQTMGLARVRGGIECPLHRGEHEAKVYRSRRGAMHWQCFRSDQGGGSLELYAALTHGGVPTEREQRRAVAAEMVARGLV